MCASGQSNRRDDGRLGCQDLLGDFAAVDIDLAREIESQSDAITLDAGDAHDTHGVRGITDDDFFPFPPRDDKHVKASCPDALLLVHSCTTHRHKRTTIGQTNPTIFFDFFGF